MIGTLFYSSTLRRLGWRVGRRIYCKARGEVANDLAANGEAYVQASVLKATQSLEAPITVFDIGANIGDWTRSLLSQLPRARVSTTKVYLFEPVPATLARLRENLSGFPNNEAAQVYPVAISDSEGLAEMVVLSETGGTNSLEFDERLAASASEVVTVKKATLTAFCAAQGIAHIHLLKCDAEGHDARVLKGALPLLKSGRIDVAQFEYNHRWIYARAFLKDIFNLVDGLPYHLARVCPRNIEVFEAWHPELERFFEGNYLIVREPALAWFDAWCGKFDDSNTYA
jgi:FkbM family methyltransferase